ASTPNKVPPQTTPDPADPPSAEPPTAEPPRDDPFQTAQDIASGKTKPKPPKKPAKRESVPEKSSLADADKLIHDLFKTYFAARRPEERQALAKKLLFQAKDTPEAPAQYVLLTES